MEKKRLRESRASKIMLYFHYMFFCKYILYDRR